MVGRESELAVLDEFLDADGPLRALVLDGGPGIGTTTLWEAGVDAGRKRGMRILRALPSGTEAQLAFAALSDLLQHVDTEVVRFLLAKRSGSPSALEAALEASSKRLEVGPLSLGATRRMLSQRLGLSLSRRVPGRVFESWRSTRFA